MILSMSTLFRDAEFYAKLGYDAVDIDLSGVVQEGTKHHPILDEDNWREKIRAEKERCEKHVPNA